MISARTKPDWQPREHAGRSSEIAPAADGNETKGEECAELRRVAEDHLGRSRRRE